MPIEIAVTTKSGTNSSRLGDAYSSYEGVRWRNAVDNCDCNGNGRVFLDCDDMDVANHISSLLDDEVGCVSYSVRPAT